MFLQNLWHHFMDGDCLCEESNMSTTQLTNPSSFVEKSTFTSTMVTPTTIAAITAQQQQQQLHQEWSHAVHNLLKIHGDGTSGSRHGMRNNDNSNNNNNNNKSNNNPFVIHHVAQTETWDCGIACLLMVLQEENKTSVASCSERKAQLMEMIGTQSIWSMDLVHLLHENNNNDNKNNNEKMAHSISYLFCTKTLQVDQEHRDLMFYRRAFDDDHVRVSNLFQRARQEDWNIMETDLQVHQVVELVKRPNCFAIALVDNTILQQYNFKKHCYAGHYIVVSGVTEDGTQLRIHNPAKDVPVEYISISLFEKSWRAKGTDNDIIFLVRR